MIVSEVAGNQIPLGDSPVADIMTTKESSRYLKLHEIILCKYATQGKIPSMRICRVWRFDKDVIDNWIGTGQIEPDTEEIRKEEGPKETG